MKFKKHHSEPCMEKGFTLIEMIIYMGIVSGVVISMIYFSLTIASSRNKAHVAQEVQSNGRTVLDILNQRIRSSTGLNSTSSTFDTHPGVLSLFMSDGSKSPTVFDISGNTLRITEGSAAAVPITSDEVKVTNLVFTNLTSATTSARENVRIQMTIEFDNPSGDVRFNYTQSWQSAGSLRQ